jgi:hypothetical protein
MISLRVAGPHDVGSTLRAVRLLRRASQVAVAHQARVSRYRLSLAECGWITLRDDELARLCRVMPELAAVLPQRDSA